MKKRLALCCLLIASMVTPVMAVAAREDEMSLRQMITQKLMIDFASWSSTDPGTAEEAGNIPPFTRMTDDVAEILARIQPGSVILFRNNLPSTQEAVKLVDDMQSAVVSSGAPAMLVATDQEGGRITRLVQGTSLPGNLAIGASGSEDNARKSGEIIGSELNALGINMVCAPDADVFSNPLNPIINTRSFGCDPKEVSRLSIAMLEGFKNTGTVAAAKHFPGHGDTATDSHTSLPIVDRDIDSVRALELVPFQALIDAGVDVIMTAHIQYPALDDTRVKSELNGEMIYLPATLSRRILTDLLRDEMGFEGVIMTDALNMDAVAEHFGVEEALIMTFEAGADIATMPVRLTSPKDVERLESAVSAVEKAVEDGRLDIEDIKESCSRILALKEKYGVMNTRIGNVDEKTRVAREVVANGEHRNASSFSSPQIH
ncbi:MAG: glycoside hydrolase family 3 N-terminal domain-containing protein [Clostridia bacterium]|nr:glycoside hydrolase family 3 N-terminal domain-containing protein [Clostridia bacterium]